MLAFSFAANENTDINNNTLLAILIYHVLRILEGVKELLNKESLQGKTPKKKKIKKKKAYFVMRRVLDHWL